MDIYDHELRAYKEEIDSLREETHELNDSTGDFNLTIFAISHSNRGHLIVVGLCSLVEACMYEACTEVQKTQIFKLSDLQGTGKDKLKKYLSRTKKIDFGKIQSWDDFKQIYKLRNTFVHSYGGLIETPNLKDAKEALGSLNLSDRLFGNRIRLVADDIEKIHKVIKTLINELKKNI